MSARTRRTHCLTTSEWFHSIVHSLPLGRYWSKPCIVWSSILCAGEAGTLGGSESYARMRLGDTVSWVFLWGSHQHSWYMRRCMTPRRSITALRVDSHAMACMRPCACTEFAVDTPGRLKHWQNFHYRLYIYMVVLVWDPITCYTICNTFNVFINTTARPVDLWVSNVSFCIVHVHVTVTGLDCDIDTNGVLQQ